MRPQVGFFGLNSTKLYNSRVTSLLGGFNPWVVRKHRYNKMEGFSFTIRLFTQPDKYRENLVHHKEPDIILTFIGS
jgi:hypothetical protein